MIQLVYHPRVWTRQWPKDAKPFASLSLAVAHTGLPEEQIIETPCNIRKPADVVTSMPSAAPTVTAEPPPEAASPVVPSVPEEAKQPEAAPAPQRPSKPQPKPNKR